MIKYKENVKKKETKFLLKKHPEMHKIAPFFSKFSGNPPFQPPSSVA